MNEGLWGRQRKKERKTVEKPFGTFVFYVNYATIKKSEYEYLHGK